MIDFMYLIEITLLNCKNSIKFQVLSDFFENIRCFLILCYIHRVCKFKLLDLNCSLLSSNS